MLGSQVQGLSLDVALIDLGPRMFEDGMVYLALNRVRTLQGVTLLKLVAAKITTSKAASKEMD